MFKKIVFLLGFVSIVLTQSEFLLINPCPNPEDFQCLTVNDCIKSELQCDGKEDCRDGSDEFEDECGMLNKKNVVD